MGHYVIDAVTGSVRKLIIFIGAGLLLAAITLADLWTGNDISLLALYAFPVAWASWSIGLPAGLFYSVAATVAWSWADLADGHRYPKEWMVYDRAANNLVILLFIAVSFHIFRKMVKAGEERVTQLEGALSVCSGCKRIRGKDGNWTELGLYLAEHTAAHPQSKLCPDCARVKYVSGYSEGPVENGPER
jgi:hypothetical protein